MRKMGIGKVVVGKVKKLLVVREILKRRLK